MKKPFKIGENVLFNFVSILFGIYSISLIFPFAWMFYNSFKTNPELFQNIWGLPEKWMFTNYLDVFKLTVGDSNLTVMFLRSVVISLIATTLGTMACAMPAYVVSKYQFKGRNFIYFIAVSILLFPTIGSVSATYKLMLDLHLFNTYQGVFLLYGGGFGLGFLLFYGFFKNLSWSYAEAAAIDGANDYTIFFKVMLPLTLPAVLSISVVSFIGIWNDFFTPYMYLPSKPTLAVGLQDLVDQMKYAANWPLLFAAMVVATIPVILVFSFFSDTIMKNTVAGGLKG